MPRGAAQEDHRELVTRVARKGNPLAHRRVHPHHEPEGAVVVVEVAVECQKFDAHRRVRASGRFLEIETNTIAPLLRAGRPGVLE